MNKPTSFSCGPPPACDLAEHGLPAVESPDRLATSAFSDPGRRTSAQPHRSSRTTRRRTRLLPPRPLQTPVEAGPECASLGLKTT